MLNLKQLQQNFAKDILNKDNLAGDYLNKQKFSQRDLMNIYHNNYVFSLIDALKATYSCVHRLVGDEFFDFLAKKYIASNQPKEGSLLNYADNFYKFIYKFPPCDTLPYLGDVARFERLYEICYHSENKVLTMNSAYPILDIWRLDENSETIDITKGGEDIQISKVNNQVVVKLLLNQGAS